jgi:hypothetical protein
VYEVTSGDGVELWKVSLGGGASKRLPVNGLAWPSMDPGGRWLLTVAVGSPFETGALLRLIPLG